MNKEISFIVTEEQENQLLAYAKQIGAESVEYPEIPQWQKDEVRKRLKEIKNNPEKTISWEEAKAKLKERKLLV